MATEIALTAEERIEQLERQVQQLAELVAMHIGGDGNIYWDPDYDWNRNATHPEDLDFPPPPGAWVLQIDGATEHH
jgi:hypothetical protein